MTKKHHWQALIILFAVALAGIIIWSAWIFVTVVNGGTIGSSTVNSSPSFNQPSLGEINAIFMNRAAEENKNETGVYRYADPSQ